MSEFFISSAVGSRTGARTPVPDEGDRSLLVRGGDTIGDIKDVAVRLARFNITDGDPACLGDILQGRAVGFDLVKDFKGS